jgi:hypothetical protein
MTKHQAPNPKQIPGSKHQIPNGLVVGAWDLVLIWCLGFGAW